MSEGEKPAGNPGVGDSSTTNVPGSDYVVHEAQRPVPEDTRQILGNASLSIGEVIAERYQIESFLGRGGMG